jgi:hypothetical protein
MIITLAQKNVFGGHIDMIYPPPVKLFENGYGIKQSPFSGSHQMRQFRIAHKGLHNDPALPHQSTKTFFKISVALGRINPPLSGYDVIFQFGKSIPPVP